MGGSQFFQGMPFYIILLFEPHECIFYEKKLNAKNLKPKYINHFLHARFYAEGISYSSSFKPHAEKQE